MSVSGGQSWEKNRQASNSQTNFPGNFLKTFQDVFGPGFGVNELIAALPQTSGLFGGQAGLQPNPQFAAAPAGNTAGMPAAPAAPAPASPMGIGAPTAQASQAPVLPGATPAAPGMPAAPGAPPAATAGAPLAPPQQAPGPKQYSTAELAGFANGTREQRRLAGTIEYLQKTNPKASYSLAEIETAANHIWKNDAQTRDISPVLGRIAAAEQVQNQMPTTARFGAPAPTVGVGAGLPGGVTGAVSALGFGTPGPQAQVQDIRTLPTINAAQVNMTDLPGFEKSVFESQFRPVERELSRQGALSDQRLSAELAQRGLAGSGTGVGQVQRQRREVGQQIQFAAEDAADRASVQRYQMEYQQKLANAGFDQAAQLENARNVLLGDTAKAKNYLDTIGLNADNAAKERTSFLNLLGLQEQDLARMDQLQLGNVDRLLNTWLQTFSTLAGAGQVQQGATEGHGHSINQSVGTNYGANAS